MKKTNVKRWLKDFTSKTVKINYGELPESYEDFEKLYDTEQPEFYIIDKMREGYIPLAYNYIEYIFRIKDNLLMLGKRGLIIILSPMYETGVYTPYVYENNPEVYAYTCQEQNGETYIHFENNLFYEEIFESYYDCLYEDRKMSFGIIVNADNIVINSETIPYRKITGYLYKNNYLYILTESNDLIGLPLIENYALIHIRDFIKKKMILPVETVSDSLKKIRRMNQASVSKSLANFCNKNFRLEYSLKKLYIKNASGKIVKKFNYSDFATIDYNDNFYMCYLPDTDKILRIHHTDNIITVSPA